MLGDPCETCGNQHVSGRIYKNGVWLCDRCGEFAPAKFYDVFFDGKPETNLVDEHGNPMVFVSKSHKAQWLKEKNLREAGDKVRGAFQSSLDRPKVDNREKYRAEFLDSYRKVKSMGKDLRRQLINQMRRERI